MTEQPPRSLFLGGGGWQILKPLAFAQTLPRSGSSKFHIPEGHLGNLGPRGLFPGLALACLAGRRGLKPGASSLKLILNKAQPPESHPSEGERARDTVRAGPRRSAPRLPAPRGYKVAAALALYGQNALQSAFSLF